MSDLPSGAERPPQAPALDLTPTLSQRTGERGCGAGLLVTGAQPSSPRAVEEHA